MTAFGTKQSSQTKPSGGARAAAEGRDARQSLELSLKDHRICMYIPAGSKVDALTLDLPGGLLVLGALRGSVTCATGSVIIAKGGEFQGQLLANDVIVEGRITSPQDSAGKTIASSMSQVHARGQLDEKGLPEGGIVAFSAGSNVCARFKAVSYSIPRTANLNSSSMETIEPLEPIDTL